MSENAAIPVEKRKRKGSHVHCGVYGCNSVSWRDKHLKFHGLPAVINHQDKLTKAVSEKRRALWIANLSIKLTKSKEKNLKVCSKHFEGGVAASACFPLDHPGWAPVLELGHNLRVKSNLRDELQKKAAAVNLKQQKVAEKRLKADRSNNTSANRPMTEINDHEYCAPRPIVPGIEKIDGLARNAACSTKVRLVKKPHMTDKCEATCQTDVTFNDFDALRAAQRKFEILKEEHRSKIGFLTMQQESFENDPEDRDKRVRFYTGLRDYATLKAFFQRVSMQVERGRNSLSMFQEFMLTLMKLRLNLTLQDLAYRFFVSKATASRIFDKWINCMHASLSRNVPQPSTNSPPETVSKENGKEGLFVSNVKRADGLSLADKGKFIAAALANMSESV